MGWGEGGESCLRVAGPSFPWDSMCFRRGPGAGGTKILRVHLILEWAL